MTIRPLGPDDLAAWRAIRAEGLGLFPEAYLTTLEEELRQSDAEVAQRLEQRLLLGAFDADRLVGTAGLDPVGQQAAVAHRVALTAFYVSPDHHGTGTAARLMRAAIAKATQAGFLQAELYVAADNPRAIRFYEREGFVRHGVSPRAARVAGRFMDDLFYVRQLDG
ncbi:GNAT family N-acetyltransferase [Limimaricola hongkongensis]|uniref:N-acetyltransferase domain-containing protein n=1 Tax=Limimaricola hongkongensis DSM 17492 TaxID=1122180 RepID=A0A017H8K6_9RHOB|nr:GNAT family N-acetyltransferase [Limimaricola hongkongensis]EYD70837.1 hypothetical protein Lokhon_02480 [Limimaricola hongkongensis DSM 17492]